MTSFYTAFRADDTLVEIIPSFDFSRSLPLYSTVPTGPFKAGIATTVPLWMALFLQQRSLASICPLAWLNTTNLAKIIAYEKKESSLFSTTDASRLPADYYEIAKRLTTKSSSNSSSLENADAIALLVQDLFEIRLDKLRQQFQSLLTEAVDTDLVVTVTGIGTQELAILQKFVTQALADQHFLAKKPGQPPAAATTESKATATTDVEKETEDATAAPLRRSRVPLRRFRS